MKAIINGKKYNTKTAKCIGEYWNYQHDMNRVDEDLYVTKNGAIFMHFEGGALTKYAQSYGNNSTTGSCGITPMSQSEAAKWIESHLDSDEQEKAMKAIGQEVIDA